MNNRFLLKLYLINVFILRAVYSTSEKPELDGVFFNMPTLTLGVEARGIHDYVSGLLLPRMYSKALIKAENPYPTKSIQEIMEGAIRFSSNNCTKEYSDVLCYRLVMQGIRILARTIIHQVKLLSDRNVRVVVFGGVAEGTGAFYEENLQRVINWMSPTNKKIEVMLSRMGDKRAIIGAVAYACTNLGADVSTKYAIGVDIGGTNIRVGLVNLKTLTIEKQIIKAPVFVSVAMREQLQLLSKKIQESMRRHKGFLNISCVNNTKTNFLARYLSVKEDQESYRKLSEYFLKRIAVLVKKCDLTDVGFISVSMTGLLSKIHGYISFNVPVITVDVPQELKLALGLPVYMGNDVDLGGVGEMLFGAGVGLQKIFAVCVGTGVGIALIERKCTRM
jgi:hypothetical protein